MSKKLVFYFLFTIFCIYAYDIGFLFAQEMTPAEAENLGDKGVSKVIVDYINKSTKIDDPFKLRDPFREDDLTRQNASLVKKTTFFQDDTSMMDVVPLKSLNLNDIKVTGILIGKERRALAQTSTDNNIILKEGMKIGENDAEIKAIMPGGIVLVEKMTNIYGQDEYLETVIPITDTPAIKKK